LAGFFRASNGNSEWKPPPQHHRRRQIKIAVKLYSPDIQSYSKQYPKTPTGAISETSEYLWTKYPAYGILVLAQRYPALNPIEIVYGSTNIE
jgi:hypothetical protein